MSYGYHSDPPAWLPCAGLIGIVVIVGGLFALIVSIEREQRARRTPPPAATVATVSTGVANIEATGRYLVETVETSWDLCDSQSALVKWIAAHPDLRIVDVIPIGGGVNGATNGFVILAEARTP